MVAGGFWGTRFLTDYLGGSAGDHLWLFADPGREWLGQHLGTAARDLGLYFEPVTVRDHHHLRHCAGVLQGLGGSHLVVAGFSPQCRLPYTSIFSPFRNPAGFDGRSAFIRPRIPDRVLLSMLATDIASVEHRISSIRGTVGAGGCFRLTSPGGTDLEVELRPVEILPYRALPDGGHAHLPPGEIYAGVVPGTAHGRIVVDVTAGEFVVSGQVVDPMGLVDHPVLITVAGGFISDVEGGNTAERLSTCLCLRPEGFRQVVEVGFGLSQGEPTGLINADECLLNTGHVGVGNDLFFGGENDVPMHLDLVIRDLAIRQK